MTSYRQIEANRRNALKSTGPKTEAGKQASRCNALRHGLTAETVIGALEDAEDYKAFQAAIIADYDAQSAVERELVLRLASILWRLRRATTMETGLFEIQAQHLRDYQENCRAPPHSNDVIQALFLRDDSTGGYGVSHSALSKIETVSHSALKADTPAVEFARCFLRLANLPNFALDRLSRYGDPLAPSRSDAVSARKTRPPQTAGAGAPCLARNGGVRIRRNHTTARYVEIVAREVTPPSRPFGHPTTRQWERLTYRISASDQDGQSDPIVRCALCYSTIAERRSGSTTGCGR